MHELNSTLSFKLRPGETAPLRIARNACLQVKHATVWLTRQGEPTDHWLGDGQSVAVNARDLLWLSNDGARPAIVELHQDGPAPSGVRFWLPLARGTHEGGRAR